MIDFGAFHFLRPAWLLLLLPGVFIGLNALRQSDPAASWRGAMAPELLDALLLSNTQRQGRWRPSALLAIMLVLGSIGLAGPTWQQQPTPFAEDQAAVFLVVKVTPSMQAQDIAPSRLQRGVQKISDFLALRQGQKTALIAYAGSAHLAMPLTRDPDIITTFAQALEPDAMPLEGADLPAAIALANGRLDRAAVPGSILLLADEVLEEDVEAVRALRAAGGAPVHVLALAAGPELVPPAGSPPAAPLDKERMAELARAGGGAYQAVTPDRRDVERLANRVETGMRPAPGNETQQWRDMGYWLLPFLALMLLSFFRPGGAVVLE